jgi:hypothetical protein
MTGHIAKPLFSDTIDGISNTSVTFDTYSAGVRADRITAAGTVVIGCVDTIGTG